MWIAIIFAEIITLLINSVQSFLWWGIISRDLLIMGAIAAFINVVIIAPFAIYFIKHSIRLDELNTQLQTEIADRMRVEEILHKSEERFRTLTESTSDWIWELDQSFVFTYVNPKVKDLLGYEPNEVIGKTPFDLMAEHEAKGVSEIAHSLLESSKPFTSLENINIRKDGRQVILETSGVPIFDKDGKFSGYRGNAILPSSRSFSRRV